MYGACSNPRSWKIHPNITTETHNLLKCIRCVTCNLLQTDMSPGQSDRNKHRPEKRYSTLNSSQVSSNIEDSSGLKCFCFAYRTKISPTHLSVMTLMDKRKRGQWKEETTKDVDDETKHENRVVSCGDDKKAWDPQEENEPSDDVA